MDKVFVKFLLGFLVVSSMTLQVTITAPTNITSAANNNDTELDSVSSIELIVEEVASNIHRPFEETKHKTVEVPMPPSYAMMRDQSLSVNTLPPNYHKIPMVDGDYSLSTQLDSAVKPTFRDVLLKSMLDYLVKNNSSQDTIHMFSNHLVKSVGHSQITDGSKGTSTSHGVSKRYTEDSRPYTVQDGVPQTLENLNDLLVEEENEENSEENTKDLSSPFVVKPIIINVPQSRLPSQPHLQTIRQDDLQFYNPYGGEGGPLRRYGRYIDHEPSYNMIQTLPQQQHEEVPNTWHVYGKHNYLILQGGNLHLPDDMALYQDNDLKQQKNNKRDNVPQTRAECKTCNCKVRSQDRKKDVSKNNWHKENSSYSTKLVDNLKPTYSEPNKPESNQVLPDSQKISATQSGQMQPFDSNNFNMRSFQYDPLIDQNEFPVNSDGQQFYEPMVNKPTKHESDRDKALVQPFKFEAQY